VNGKRPDHAQHKAAVSSQDSDARRIDPVCGMSVAPARAKHKWEYGGETYYFCSDRCSQRFQAKPEKYCGNKSDRVRIAEHDGSKNYSRGRVVYTCPMHPEVARSEPGSCPKCGMELEPRQVAAAGEEPSPELKSMTRRFWASLALTIPMLGIAMVEMIPGLSLRRLFSAGMVNGIQLVLATPVVLWGGWPFFERGWQSIVRRSLNMFTLIGLGTGAAYLFSLLSTIVPQILPAAFLTAEGAAPVYFESAAVIVTLVLLGQVLELRARQRTGGAIRALLGLAAKTARILHEDGREEDIPVEEVRPGDKLRVRPGEKVPVDGVVIEGKSNFRPPDTASS